MVQTRGIMLVGNNYNKDQHAIVEMQDVMEELHHHNQALENIVNFQHWQ